MDFDMGYSEGYDAGFKDAVKAMLESIDTCSNDDIKRTLLLILSKLEKY